MLRFVPFCLVPADQADGRRLFLVKELIFRIHFVSFSSASIYVICGLRLCVITSSEEKASGVVVVFLSFHDCRRCESPTVLPNRRNSPGGPIRISNRMAEALSENAARHAMASAPISENPKNDKLA